MSGRPSAPERLAIVAAGVLACVDTMEPADGLWRVPVSALKDLAAALEEASPGLLARVAPGRAEAGLPPIAASTARSRYLLDGYTGPNCAGCGDEIPAGTPPYPADLTGTGRLCAPCERLTGATEHVACVDCEGKPLFGIGEIDEHRRLTHPARHAITVEIEHRRGRTLHRAVCSCGQRGLARPSPAEAEESGRIHVERQSR